MCADSLASCALAGWIRSPCASSTSVTGCWASQSISRSGRSLRSSLRDRDVAAGVAEPDRRGDVQRPPAPRPAPGVQRARRGGGQMNSRSSRFNLTGSRPFGRWPEPSSVTSSPPVASASAAPCAMRPDQVAVAVDHERRAPDPRAHLAEVLVAWHADPADRVDQRLGRRLERPADAVLDLLGRVRLAEALGEEELEEPEVVPPPVVAVVLRPTLVGVERLVERVHVALGVARRPAATAGPMYTIPSTRSGCSAARIVPHSAPQRQRPRASPARCRSRPAPRARRRRTRRCCSPRLRPAGPTGRCRGRRRSPPGSAARGTGSAASRRASGRSTRSAAAAPSARPSPYRSQKIRTPSRSTYPVARRDTARAGLLAARAGAREARTAGSAERRHAPAAAAAADVTRLASNTS